MHGLYPIVRRVRRPLLVRDAPPVMAQDVEPVAPTAQTTDDGPQTTGPTEVGTTHENDAATTSIAAE